MRKRLCVVSVVFASGLLPMSAFAAGTLSGHVRNAANSAPIAGATVLISPGGSSTTTDGSGLYSVSLPAGMYSVTATATDFRAAASTTFAVVTDAATTTLDVGLVLEVLTPATFDAASLHVPTCLQPGQAGCDSGTLLVGRDTIAGGAEPNQPNTIVYSQCADGTAGTFHVEESLDRLRVYTLDGSPLAFGKTILIEATVWSNSADRLDLWAESYPILQNWTYVATLTPPAGTGLHTLFATYVLPAGGTRQVLRGNLRRGGTPSTCSSGTVDDHDDLVFSVVGNPMPTIDFDGDHLTDLAMYRPSTGDWWIRQSGGGYASSTSVNWGNSGDIPVPGDYDGDGKGDVAVYRPSTGVWYIRQSKTNFATTVTLSWGGNGFLPAPGDYDGDGLTDPTVYSPSSGTWFGLSSRSNFTTSFSYRLNSTVGGSSTDVPVPGDYDGDGITDMAVYRPANGVWYILGSTFNFGLVRYSMGIGGDVPVPGDYDGDSQTDLAVYRPSTGKWIIRLSNFGSIGGTYYTSIARFWGLSGDTPVPGDYDGDGKTDIAIFRPGTGTWWVLQSSTNFTNFVSYSWGANGDLPLPNVVTTTAAARNTVTVSMLASLSRGSDFDSERDGISDMSVFRPSTKQVLTLLSRGGFANTQPSGNAQNSTDIPVPGYYLGWGIQDFAAFYRPTDGTWYGTGLPDIQWGVSTDTPVPGDYDGDGRTDIAVYRPSTGTWWILKSGSNFTSYSGIQWGMSTDITVPGDYDGDGKTDVAVFRPSAGTWYILKSSTNFSTNIIAQWGTSTDIPVPGEFDGDGKTDIAIFRPSTGTWWVLQSITNFTNYFSRQNGMSGDIPILRRQ